MRTTTARSGGGGFTLLEVILAVAMLAMLTISLHRFVGSVIRGLRVSNELSLERAEVGGVLSLLQVQLDELPANGPRWFAAQPHRFGGASADTMEWECPAGPGVMTSAAPGMYRVALELRPVKGGREQELGLRRRPVEGTSQEENWLPLLRPVQAVEFRYYHAALNSKVDRWTDNQTVPTLVYVSIQRRDGDAPVDSVLTVRAAKVQK